MRRIVAGAAALLMWGTASTGAVAAPAQSDGEPTISVTDLIVTGCGSGEMGYSVLMTGMPYMAGYMVRVKATLGGVAYSDEAVDVAGTGADKSYYFSIYDLFTYHAPEGAPGVWPMPAGVPIVVDLTVEDGSGAMLDGWTTKFDRCDGGDIVANGHARELTIDRRGHHRVGGTVSSYGGPETYAGVQVRVWKAQRGRDRLVATTRASTSGAYAARVPARGRYYATTPRLVLASGESLISERSPTVD